MNETKQNFQDFAIALSPFLGGGGLPTDIDDETLADGQVLKYNATSGKWVNANGVSYTETPASQGGGTQATITT